MKSSLKIRKFFELYRHKLQLTFVSTEIGQEREIMISRQASDSFEAVDYFNVIRTSSIVVVGYQESRYIGKLAEQEQIKLLKTLFQGPVSTLIICAENQIPETMVRQCEERNIPVFRSALSDAELLDKTRHYLTPILADHTDEHGVYVEVYSLGVFLTGESGVGKSELALALVARGHRLISDDVTRFSRISPDTVDGQCSSLLSGFMEVRGLGIVNVRAMFGANALKHNKALRLIVNMISLTNENATKFDRLGNNIATRNILGLEIPEVTLPVAPGRNLAVLVEAAARNHLLNLNGYSAATDFIQRQNAAIAENYQANE
ncbi:MAG: HPr kinase/phosphorylase [Gammaproteobacteria bacterium]|jgi:HPr kinase/phosphorylase